MNKVISSQARRGLFRIIGTPEYCGKVALMCQETAFAVPNFQKMSLRGPALRRWTTQVRIAAPHSFFSYTFSMRFLDLIFPVHKNITSRARLYCQNFLHTNNTLPTLRFFSLFTPLF